MSVLNEITRLFPDGDKTSNRWYNISCPFCNDSGKHYGINYQLGYTNCFRCGTKHKLAYFFKLMGIECDLKDLSDTPRINISVNKDLNIEFPYEYISIYDLLSSESLQRKQALDYVDKRIGIDLAIKLNIGFCDIGVYANRIIIPVFNDIGDVIYFVARSIYKFIDPKIKNPYGPRPTMVFNWDKAQQFSEIYLCEGVFGSIIMFPYGVATFGKEVTDGQILTILRSDVKIINIVLDGNAISNANKLANRIVSLTNKVKVRVLKLKPECQPDDHDFRHILSLRDLTPFHERVF